MKNKTLVMIPGPTPLVEVVKDEMARDIQAFGDPRFVKDYKSLIDGMHDLYQCDGKTFVLAGTGTLGMEFAIANATKKDDNILVISHGFFGDRFVEIGERKGLKVDLIQSQWGKTVSLDEVKEKLQSKDYALVTLTHVDTSTGVASDVEGISNLLKDYPNTIFVVDGICSVGAYNYNLQDLGIDYLLTGSQKAFGVSPGLFMIWASQKALDRRASLGMIPEYYVDLEKWVPIMDDPSKYFATPAVNLIWSMKAALNLIQEEGAQAREDRHRKHAQACAKAYQALGFELLADEECRAITLSNLIYPEGLDDVTFRNTILEEGGVIAGGLGAYAGKMCRIGHMGNIDESDLIAGIGIVERALSACGFKDKVGLGVSTFLQELSK